MFEIYKDKEGTLLFRKSFCAYLDILGFSNKINKKDLSFFSKYLEVLGSELKYIEGRHDLSGNAGRKQFELKIFTDNFVFGHPWYDEYGESELGNIFEVLAHIQFTFIRSKIFVRGAISVSDLYMDENIVLGPALIDSYELETNKAIYPRIILSDSVVEIVKKHIGYYADHASSPQNTDYLIDIDGLYFINYLSILLEPKELLKARLKEIMEHKEIVEECLLENIDNYKIFEKYSWVAKYHNFFCNEFLINKFSNKEFNKLLIERNKFDKTILRIF